MIVCAKEFLWGKEKYSLMLVSDNKMIEKEIVSVVLMVQNGQKYYI